MRKLGSRAKYRFLLVNIDFYFHFQKRESKVLIGWRKGRLNVTLYRLSLDPMRSVNRMILMRLCFDTICSMSSAAELSHEGKG